MDAVFSKHVSKQKMNQFPIWKHRHVPTIWNTPSLTPHDAFVGACFDQRQQWRHFMADSGGIVVKTYESETGSLTSYNTQRKGPRPPETKLLLVSTKIPFYDLPGDEGIVYITLRGALTYSLSQQIRHKVTKNMLDTLLFVWSKRNELIGNVDTFLFFLETKSKIETWPCDIPSISPNCAERIRLSRPPWIRQGMYGNFCPRVFWGNLLVKKETHTRKKGK